MPHTVHLTALSPLPEALSTRCTEFSVHCRCSAAFQTRQSSAPPTRNYAGAQTHGLASSQWPRGDSYVVVATRSLEVAALCSSLPGGWGRCYPLGTRHLLPAVAASPLVGARWSN